MQRKKQKLTRMQNAITRMEKQKTNKSRNKQFQKNPSK